MPSRAAHASNPPSKPKRRGRPPLIETTRVLELDARQWLRENGHADTARLIDQVESTWSEKKKRTRRNWWDVLAGSPRGRPRKVAGVVFPVLAAAQVRQGQPKTKDAIPISPRKKATMTPPPARAGTRWRNAGGARPFLKWAGGKRQLLPAILAELPEQMGTFHEPFVGGGAVFFGLRPRTAVLSDRNQRLVRAYHGIKHAVDEVIDLLRSYKNNRKFFLEMRGREIDSRSDAEVAAWLIYLNKTGFNGLYRVNSRNFFNVPFGDNPNATLCDAENLRACAAALAHAEINNEDFSAVLDRARPGDVVYFDPPYVPMSATSYFTSYTSDGFDMTDQVRLRDVALGLRERGVFVLLSNSSAPAVKELYGPPFTCLPVSATRMVNSDTSRRGPITELLIK